jgi:hypothetical protein
LVFSLLKRASARGGETDAHNTCDWLISLAVAVPTVATTVVVTMAMAADVQVDARAVSIFPIDTTTGMAAVPVTAMPITAARDLLCGGR